MKRKLLTSVMIITFLISSFTGCNGNTNSNSEQNNSNQVETLESENAGILDTSNMFTDEDMNISYDESTALKINLSDINSIEIGNGVSVENGVVTISSGGTYILSGSLSEGQLVVDITNKDDVKIVLDNVDITSSSSAPLYIKEAGNVYVTMSENSVNTLSNTGEFLSDGENNIDGVVFSKSDITFNGNGILNINTEYGHGIVSKDSVIFTSGTYNINSSGHGISGKDDVRIADGDFVINSGKDGIHSENSDDASKGYVYIVDGTYNINSGYDGIDGVYTVQINSGEFNIVSGGGNENTEIIYSESGDTASTKGIKSDGDMFINNGKYNINSYDDAIHSNGNIFINNGTFSIMTGDDGIHSDLQVTVNGGDINISKSYEGIEGQTVNIENGNIYIMSDDDGINSAGGNDSLGIADRQGRMKDSFAVNENCNINIKGGNITINAEGDGIDSNGNLYITGGETYIYASERGGNGALDYNGEGTITGGIVAASGISGMMQNFGENSTQGSILLSSQSMQSEVVSVTDSNGDSIIEFQPEKQYNSIVVSTPDIIDGGTYNINMGTENTSVTMSGLIYGSGKNMGGHGGRGMSPNGQIPEKTNGERPEGEPKEFNGEEPKEPPQMRDNANANDTQQ